MNHVTVFVNHQVAIVSVLDLQQVGENAVSCHRLGEVSTRSLEFLTRFLSEFLLEIREQTGIDFATDLVT